MSVIEKVFHYEESKLSVLKFKDEIWFKAKQVALLLGYLDPCRSIRQNVDPEDRISLEKLIGKGGGGDSPPPPFSFELPIEQVIEYFRDVKILCSYCPRRFISSQSLRNHIKSFHKM